MTPDSNTAPSLFESLRSAGAVLATSEEVDLRDVARVESSTDTASIIADLRGDR